MRWWSRPVLGFSFSQAEKFVVGWGGGVVGWWSRPSLGFSFRQAEQLMRVKINASLYFKVKSAKSIQAEHFRLNLNLVTIIFIALLIESRPSTF